MNFGLITNIILLKNYGRCCFIFAVQIPPWRDAASGCKFNDKRTDTSSCLSPLVTEKFMPSRAGQGMVVDPTVIDTLPIKSYIFPAIESGIKSEEQNLATQRTG